MKLIEVISNLDLINEDRVLYVKKIDGEFRIESDTKLILLTEEELEWKPDEVTAKKCPSYEYFIEVFIIKEFFGEELEGLVDFKSAEEKCKRIIHYAVFDA